MRFIYSFSIYTYSFFILLASVFNKKASQWVKGRSGQWEKLKKSIQLSDKIIWVHCASLGEFEQGRPVIENLRTKYPGFKVLLTFFSPSGYEIRKNYPGADYVFYLPADTSSNAHKFILLINPSLVIFVKYEFWYNYLDVLREKKVPLFLISAIFRPGQHFFKPYGSWFRKQLRCFTHFFVQDEASKELLNGIGLNNVTVSGDTRFDRVYELSQGKTVDEKVKRFRNDTFTVIAGSTWEQDENLIIQYINKNKGKQIKWIIAPHVISETHIARFISKVNTKCVRYSQEGEVKDADVLIIDNIGMLGNLYHYADIAHIGGGFGKGIHNILEPAAYGLPVVFGPRYEKFREAKELLELKGAFTVNNYAEYERVMNRLISEEAYRKSASEVCRNYTVENRGASNRISEGLGDVLFGVMEIVSLAT